MAQLTTVEIKSIKPQKSLLVKICELQQMAINPIEPQKKTLTFHSAGCFIGILMIYMGSRIPYIR